MELYLNPPYVFMLCRGTSLRLLFPPQTCMPFSSFPSVPYALSISPSVIRYPSDIWRETHIMQLFFTPCVPASYYFLIAPDSLFSLLLSNAWFIFSLLSVRKLPHNATGTVIALQVYMFTFLGMRREDKSFEVNSRKHFAKLICS